MYSAIILNLKLLFVDSTAQSVLCQPIVQSNGELVGKLCTITLVVVVVVVAVVVVVVVVVVVCLVNWWHALISIIYTLIFKGVIELCRRLGHEAFGEEDDEVIYWFKFCNPPFKLSIVFNVLLVHALVKVKH